MTYRAGWTYTTSLSSSPRSSRFRFNCCLLLLVSHDLQGGLDLFLRLIRSSMDKSLHSPLLLPSLWGLRNLTHSNRVIMTKLGRRGGMELLLEVIRR